MMRRAVRQPVMKFVVPHPVLVLSHGWPCWLPSIISLRLTIVGAYFPANLHKFFTLPPGLPKWLTVQDWARESQVIPRPVILLGSGSWTFFEHTFCKNAANVTQEKFIFVVDTNFSRLNRQRLASFFGFIKQKAFIKDFKSRILRHKNFGGASNAAHIVVFGGIPTPIFEPGDTMERTLKHLLDPAARGHFVRISEPPALGGTVPRDPIVVDKMLRREGLYDVYAPHRTIAVPSVFSDTKWVARTPTIKELLRIFDLPVAMDKLLVTHHNNYLAFGIANTMSPLVTTAIFRNWWGIEGGGARNRTDLSHNQVFHSACDPPVAKNPSTCLKGDLSTSLRSTVSGAPSLSTRVGSLSSASTIPVLESIDSSDYSGVRSELGFDQIDRHGNHIFTTTDAAQHIQTPSVWVDFQHIAALNCRGPGTPKSLSSNLECNDNSQQPRTKASLEGVSKELHRLQLDWKRSKRNMTW